MVALIYGGLCYVLFLFTTLYAVGFVGNLVVPKSIDSGSTGPIGPALVIDLAVLGLFALQHSAMARQAFKRRWTRLVPPSVERSTYVLLSSLALILLFRFWRPLPDIVWSVTNPVGAGLLSVFFWAGWVIVVISTFLINHFDLFGLQQVWTHARGGPTAGPSPFRTPLLYEVVRHPIYFGFLLAFWSTPVMTYGHLLFALATTAYVFVGMWLEERDLVTVHGEDYVAYRQRVSMIVPMPPRRRGHPPAG